MPAILAITLPWIGFGILAAGLKVCAALGWLRKPSEPQDGTCDHWNP